LLTQLSNELTDFRTAQYGPDPDVAAMLYEASLRLPNEDTAGMLATAAEQLRALDVEMINTLADAINGMQGIDEGLVERITDAANALTKATRRLPEY
jgi:hypothetical protein